MLHNLCKNHNVNALRIHMQIDWPQSPSSEILCVIREPLIKKKFFQSTFQGRKQFPNSWAMDMNADLVLRMKTESRKLIRYPRWPRSKVPLALSHATRPNSINFLSLGRRLFQELNMELDLPVGCKVIPDTQTEEMLVRELFSQFEGNLTFYSRHY